MINIFNISECFEKNKSYLIEIFVSEYGEAYRGKIVEVFNALYVNFDSKPFENYLYALKHGINKEELNTLNEACEQYDKIVDEAYDISANKMKDYIINHFNILNLTYEPVANHLFYSYNFSEGYIDSFSINNQRLLNEVDTPLSIKEKILENQEKCKQYMQKLGIDIEKISQDTIEDFIKFREERIIETKLYIMENSDYGNKIYNELKIKCENNEIYYDQMESMCFEKIPYAFLTYYPEKEKIYHFIKYPLSL